MDASRGKLPVIEYLRGCAALMVTWFHLTNQYPVDAVRVSGALGWLGVPVFFVISGFVVPLSIWRRHGTAYSLAHFPSFAMRRLVRLEPPYLVSIALVVLLWHLSTLAPAFRGSSPNVGLAQVLAHIGYLPPLLGHEWLQPVYWTLAYEFCFYALVGLLMPLVLRSPLLVLCGAVVSSVALGQLLTSRIDPLLPLFGLGIVAFAWTRELLSTPRCVLASAIMLALSASADWRVALVGAICAAAIALAGEFRLSGSAHRIATFVGTISYSLYVIHVPIGGRVVNLGARFVETELGRFAVSAVALMVSLGFAALFWRYVERPFVSLASRLGARKPRPHPRAALP